MNKNIILVFLILILCGCGKGGDPLAQIGFCDLYSVAEKSHYILPYASGEKHEVLQGNCQGLTHFGPQRYAYDFKMSVGTKILATRAGKVIDVKEDSEDRVGLCSEGNYVRIQHEGGTVADYLHLKKDGALVEKDDDIEQGDIIAESGLTGCTGGLPHLHFVVWKDGSYEYGVGKDSVPVTFNNSLPRIDWALKHLQVYQAE